MGWAVVRQLVARPASGDDALDAAIADAARAALEHAPDEPQAGDAALARTLHALWWVAADLAAQRPLLICVDDAQWSDAPSLRFLAHLARRIDDLPIALIVATRPPAQRSGPLAELTAGRIGRRLAPQPLSDAAIAELCTRDEVVPAAAVLAALHGASGGNPFLAGQLVAELDARGLALADPATATAIAGLGPATISRALLSRLPDDAVALGVGRRRARRELPTRGSPRRWRGLDAADVAPAIDALVAGHVLDGAGDELRFVHPVVREAVLAELGAGPARAAACRRGGRAARRAARRSSALRRISPPPPPARCPAPRCCCARRRRCCSPTATPRPPRATCAARSKRRRTTARSPRSSAPRCWRARDFDAARDVLRAAVRAADTLDELAERLAARASVDARDRRADAGDRGAARGARRVAGRTGARRRRARARGAAGDAVLVRARGDGAQRRAPARASPTCRPTGRPQRTLLALLAQRAMYEVRPAHEVAALAERALGDGAYAADAADGLIPWGNAVNTLIAADRARRRAARGRARAPAAARRRLAGRVRRRQRSSRRRRRGGAATSRQAEAEAEAVIAALAFSDPGATIAALRAVATRHLALAALERDDVAAAVAAIERFDADCPDAAELIPITRLRQVRGDGRARARRSRARAPRGVRARRAGARGAHRHAVGAVARAGGDRAAAAGGGGRGARAGGRAARAGAPLGRGERRRRRAAAERARRRDASRRLELLEQSIALLEAAPWRLELARALADLGTALRVARRRADAARAAAPRRRARRGVRRAGAARARARRARRARRPAAQAHVLGRRVADGVRAADRRARRARRARTATSHRTCS